MSTSKPRRLRVLDAFDRRFLNEMQDCFPLAPNPFLELGTSAGLAEEDAITRMRALCVNERFTEARRLMLTNLGLANLWQEETVVNG